MPKLWLAKPDKKIIQRLNGIENLQGTFNYMNQNQITFDVNSHIFDEMTQEQKKNPAIHKVKNKYLIKFVYNGQEDWFVINNKSEQAQEKDYISITADYIGKELDTKRIGDIEEIGITIESLFNKFLPVVALNWSVRHIDPKLAKVKREYNLSDASVSSLIEAVCEQTDAVVVFHNFDRQLSFIHRDNAGKFKGLKVKESTYLKSFTDTQNSADLVTRLYLMGKDGLTINGINPAGTSYIEDFSYFMKPFERDSNRRVIRHSDYMSDALCHALLDYQEYFSNRQGDYEKLSEDYEKLLKEQLEEDFKLSEISATLSNLEERIEVLKPRGGYTEKRVRGNTSFNMMYNTYYMMTIQNKGSLARITVEGKEYMVSPNEYAYIKIKTPSQVDVGEATLSYPVNILASNPNLVIGLSTSSEEDFKEEDVKELDKKYNVYKYRELYATQYAIVTAVEKRVEIYNQNRKDINDSLSVQSFFTPELLAERENFINDGMWREENHTDAKELLEDGRKQLAEKNNVVRTTQVDIIDFVQSLEEEDQKNWDKLVAGDKIRFSNDTYESNLEAFISELSISFDENDVTLTLSDVIDLSDKSKGVANQLAGFMSTANQVNKQKSQIDENAGKTNEVLALLEAEWDANKRRILAGNETVDIGAHGIKITSPTHPNEMLMAVAGVIAISDDYGETFKQAINTRGVVAERLIGKVILGTELVMENNSGTMRFDDEGVRINASNFHLIADDGENYFDNLLKGIEQEFVTYEEKIKEDIKHQKESFESELADVSKGLTEYTNNLLDALADGVLTAREIDMLKMQMHMLEADYAQVRRRVLPLIQSTDVDPVLQYQLYSRFYTFEDDYRQLVDFINKLDKPQEIPINTIKKIKILLQRFKPAIEELIGLVENTLEESQRNQIANAEYNSRTFSENLMVDLEDELSDLNNALEGFDLSFKGALADGVLDMIERSQISDAMMRMKSEKSDVDNRYVYLSVHENIKNTSQLTTLQNAKRDYDTSFNTLINRINYILAREKITVEMIEDYKTAYTEFTAAMVRYSAIYEESLEYVQNRYADTKAGEAQKYADGLKLEVDADIKDVSDNVTAFAEDVYGAFKDGIITEQERNRLDIHRKMLEKEKSDVIERYNTIITSRYLQGFFDTEKLVQARALYGEVHADLLLQIELAMMDDEITKEEADTAVRLFEEYVERLTEFSVQLELAIAAIGHSKAVWQTEEELKNYISVSVFNDEIAQMQATLDGHIMTWYYDYEPTLNNIPAKDWTTTEEKNAHVGDLFYHETEGFAYRFMKSGSTYKWELIKDTEVTKALQDAQHALDLADDKRRVFVTTPKAPYDIGDLWIMGDGELMRARTARKESESYSENDWIKATKYTDDTKANAVENQLNIFQKNVNAELEDLEDAYEAFKKTVEGAFRDGIIEDYELKILLSQAQSLDREKADVDALYNQLLNRADLTSSERSTLVSKYNSFSSTHQSLVSGIRLAIEDGKISDEELEAVTIALENYPQALKDIREYLHKLINDVITRVSEKADGALEGVKRFDTWKSSSFEVDSEKIATRVGESSWETKWFPEVNDKLTDIGSENLIPYSSAQGIVDNWTTVEQGAERRTILTKPTSGTPAYQNTARVYSSSVLADQYFGVRSPRFPRDIIEGETYTLSLKTTNIASAYDDMRYTYLMREGHSGTNQSLFSLKEWKSTPITRPDGVSATLHTVTFKANFSGGAGIMIATRSSSNVAAQFHLYEPMLVQGSVAPQWSESPQDKVEVLNTEIKSNYSTTKQTKELLGSYVTSTEMKGNLDKIATYASSYSVGKGSAEFLREANGSVFDDAFSYEVTAHTPSVSDSLLVTVLNSKGKGKGWDVETLEEKGTTGSHPRIYFSGSYPAVTKWSTTTKSEVQVVYTKYAGSFTNLSKTNSMIEQKADVITSRVANIASNRPNIVPYTDFTVDSDKWGSTGKDSWYALNSSTKLSLSWDNYLLGNNDSTATASFIGIFTPVFTQRVVSGREITLSFLGAYPGQVETFNRIALRNMDTGAYQWFNAQGSSNMDYTPVDQTNQPGYNHGLYSITVTPNFTGEARFLIGGFISGDPKAAWIRISNVKVEKAGNASAYTPSSNDANERWSQIQQTTDSITSEVGKKVGNNEIISKINQSAEKISIDANKIELTAGSSLRLAVDGINNLSVGEENLLTNTTVNSANLDELGSLRGTKSIVRVGGMDMFQVRTTSSTYTYYGVYLNRGSLSDAPHFSVKKGQEYVLSLVGHSSLTSGDFNYTYLYRDGSGSNQSLGTPKKYVVPDGTNGTHRFEWKFTANWDSDEASILLGARVPERWQTTDAKWFRFAQPMLQAGNQFSGYQLSPRDVTTNNQIISAINMDKSSMKISSDKLSISAKDISIDGKTIDISSNSSVTSLKKDVTAASNAADAAHDQADRARNGNNIAASLNLKGTTTTINGSKIDLVGDVSMVNGRTRIKTLDFNTATASGGSGSSTLSLSRDTIELEGRYKRTWRGVTRTEDVFTRMRNGHLRFRNNSQNRSLYYSDFGISTYVDGEGDGDASGTLSFFDNTYSTVRGITMHSTFGVAALKSENNRVILEAGKGNFIYAVTERLRVIRNADRIDSYSEIQFSDGLANSIRVTDERADFYIGVSTNELRVTNNLRYNAGKIGWQPVHCATLKTENAMVTESHSGVNAYFGVGTKRMRVTDNNGYNGGKTGYREIDAADFNHASSERFKRDITEWDYSVLDILKNEVKIYQYKLKSDDDTENSMFRRGVILERETPVEWVNGDTVRSYEMTTWAIKGIQELGHENDELKKELYEAKKKNQELEERLEKLEQILLK